MEVGVRRNRKLFMALVVTTLLGGCAATNSFLYPEVSLQLRPGQGDPSQQLYLRGYGIQQFRCVRDDQGFYWKYLKTEATLKQISIESLISSDSIANLKAESVQVFTHQDGSVVKSTKIDKHIKGRTENDIPLMRMSAHSNCMGTRSFDSVKYILRIDTKGGMPFISCDAANLEMLHDAPFEATYVFWK